MVKKIKNGIFLLDSIGALVSAICIIMIIRYHYFFGMPKNVLYLLLPIPLLFSLVSFLLYLFSNFKWRIYLKFIALANVAYCILTLIITFLNYEKLTKFGVFYFIFEILIITILAMIEFKIASNNK